MISTASRVGTGNIADIATAIATGGKIAIKTLKNYEEQKNAGKNPVFYGSEIGIKGTVWNKKGD